MCYHAGPWARAPQGPLVPKACLCSPLLLPAPLASQLCGIPQLCWIPQLCGTFWLCLTPPALARQVNTTLDYDSEAVAAVGFQFTATIVVTAGGEPPRSSECSGGVQWETSLGRWEKPLPDPKTSRSQRKCSSPAVREMPTQGMVPPSPCPPACPAESMPSLVQAGASVAEPLCAPQPACPCS